MGEFDDLDPTKLAESVDQQREALQQEKAEVTRKAQEESKRRAATREASLDEAEDRTVELFGFLVKAFQGRKISINQDLLVERTGSRPEGIGHSRMDEKPSWIVIRAAATVLSARHQPKASPFTPEYVLAARCGVNTRYELLIYPIKHQDRPNSFATDGREEFLERIQDEIASR